MLDNDGDDENDADDEKEGDMGDGDGDDDGDNDDDDGKDVEDDDVNRWWCAGTLRAPEKQRGWGRRQKKSDPGLCDITIS